MNTKVLDSALRPRVRPAHIPLSDAQRRFWPGTSPAQRTPCVASLVLRVRGAIDRDAFEAALGDIVERHTSLRTIFPDEGGVPCQQIVDIAGARPVLQRVTTTKETVGKAMADALASPLDVRRDPPLRAFLFEAAGADDLILLAIHHIAIDAWSIRPLINDFLRAYTVRRQDSAPRFPALPLQYTDYVYRHREKLGVPADIHSRWAQQLEFWTNQLADLPPEIPLPDQLPPTASLVPEVHTLELDEDVHGRLLATAHVNAVNLFTVLHSGLAAWLTRFGAKDVVIGTPVSGRTEAAIKNLVGLFENTILLRTDVRDNPTFRQLLSRAHQTDSAAFEHLDLPFSELPAQLGPAGSTSERRPFQIMMVLQSFEESAASLPMIRTNLTPGSTSRGVYDLLFTFTENRETDGTPAGIKCAVEYDASRMARAAAATMLSELNDVLARFSRHPDWRIQAAAVAEGESETDVVALPSNFSAGTKSSYLPGVSPWRPFVAPQNVLQDQLAHIWEQVLQVSPIGIWDEFGEMGGGTLVLAEVMQRIEHVCGCRIGSAAFSESLTVRGLAEALMPEVKAGPIIEIHPGQPESTAPIFLLHGDLAGGGFYALELSRGLDARQPFYVLQQHGLNGKPVPDTVEAMAADHLDELARFWPRGPYRLAGFCSGGFIALEMANRLWAMNEKVESLVLIDLPLTLKAPSRATVPARSSLENMKPADFRGAELFNRYINPVRAYTPSRYFGDLDLIVAREKRAGSTGDPMADFGELASKTRLYTIPGNHVTCVGRYVRDCAAVLRSCLMRAS